MISQLLEALRQLFGASLPWIVVPPWCVGVRVRLGRRAARLESGFHFRIPLLDQVQLVSTRTRYVSGQPVTIQGSRPGYARTRCATVSFAVVDPIAALLRFADLVHMMQALATLHSGDAETEAEALAALRAEVEGHGVEVHSFKYSENVEVRAFRLMQQTAGLWVQRDPDEYR